MRAFRKKQKPDSAAQVQLRQGGRHPFGAMDGYVPLGRGDLAVYRAIREAVPVVDAAVAKLVRLCGGVTVQCRDGDAQEGLERFLKLVPTGRGQRGIQSFPMSCRRLWPPRTRRRSTRPLPPVSPGCSKRHRRERKNNEGWKDIRDCFEEKHFQTDSYKAGRGASGSRRRRGLRCY